jgi:outer membrane protein
MNMKNTFCFLIAFGLISQEVDAQQPFVEPPPGKRIIRDYKPASLPPIAMSNSQRLHSLIRAGKLYLTLQDAIALAIENNLDLQVDRYGPLNAEWSLRRSQGGGALAGVTQSSSLVNTAVSGQGVNGALSSAGITTGGGNNGGGGGGGGTIQQIGPVTPNLDTFFQNSSFWSHRSIPEPFTFAGVSELIQSNRGYNSLVQQGLITGGIVQFAFNQSYLKENSPGDTLNPSLAPVAQLSARQSLLNGFGKGVNSRFIRVSRNQLSASTETFRSQLLALVANVVNQYWDLASTKQDFKEKDSALEFAQKFLEDTNHEIQLGAIAKVDIYRAEAEMSNRKQDLLIAQQNVQQQETNLKTVLSRDGLEDPLLEAAQIVTLDRLEVPANDDLPPLRDLVTRAMAKRPDMLLSKINDENQAITSEGTRNGILPLLQVAGSTTNRAEAGTFQPSSGQKPPPNSEGGFGTALAQILKHEYTSIQGSVAFQGRIGNHTAQADYGIDQLQLRQGDLMTLRNRNDVVVAISNQVIALRQARSRYQNAVASRRLQQDLMEKEQQKFRLGSSTIDLLIAAQRALSAAESTEIAAVSQYSHARVALDQVMGETLETNHVSVEEALKGTVSYESKIPVTVP